MRDDSTATFGVSGILRNSALVMYDRKSTSLWTQRGRAIAGPLKGMRLRPIPSQRTAWVDWREQHPHTMGMAPPWGSVGEVDPSVDAED